MYWVGVDVGGPRKGFDVAAVRGATVELASGRLEEPEDVLQAVRDAGAADFAVIAIDSPQCWAPDEHKSRPCERAYLKKKLSGIFFTPSRELAEGNPFYDWIRNGMRLYDLLASEGLCRAIEVFPTASWSVWYELKSGRRKSWTRLALRALESQSCVRTNGLVTNQDKRDAVAAALTAKQFHQGTAEVISDTDDCQHPASLCPGIVIPKRDSLP